jgi:hypothetical protein
MNEITILLLSAVLVFAGGCSTSHERIEHLNAAPEWYWNEAWVGEIGGDKRTKAIVDEITSWAFTLLFHGQGFQAQPLPGPKYVGVRDYPSSAGLKDPSSTVIAALRAAGYDVKPCSDLRFPSEDEREPDNPGRYRGIEHPDTGERVYVYYVTIQHVISPTLARITVGQYNGPLGGGGSELIIEKRGGVWKVFLKANQWVS